MLHTRFMVVAALEVHLRLEGCASLKAKRGVIRPILDKAHRDFKVASAEVGDHDLWGNAVLGFACVGSNAVVLEAHLQKLLEWIETSPCFRIEHVIRTQDRV